MPGRPTAHSLPRMKTAMARNDPEETELLRILHQEFAELRSHIDRLLRAALDPQIPLDERAAAVAGLRDLARFAAARERLRSS